MGDEINNIYDEENEKNRKSSSIFVDDYKVYMRRYQE